MHAEPHPGRLLDSHKHGLPANAAAMGVTEVVRRRVAHRTASIEMLVPQAVRALFPQTAILPYSPRLLSLMGGVWREIRQSPAFEF